MSVKQQPADISPSLAIFVLVLVLGGYLYFLYPSEIQKVLAGFETYANENENFVLVSLGALSINVAWIASVVGRSFGFRKQGSRLESLTGKKIRSPQFRILSSLCAFTIALAFYCVADLALFFKEYKSLGAIISMPIAHSVWPFVIGNISAFIFVILSSFFKIDTLINLIKTKLGTRLVKMPMQTNCVAIGTIGEEVAQ